MSWARIEAHLYRDPRIRAGGFWAGEAFLVAVLVCKDISGRGRIPPEYATPAELAHWRGVPEDLHADFAGGLSHCIAVGLLAVDDGGGVSIPGWRRYQMDPSAAARMQRHRDNRLP